MVAPSAKVVIQQALYAPALYGPKVNAFTRSTKGVVVNIFIITTTVLIRRSLRIEQASYERAMIPYQDQRRLVSRKYHYCAYAREDCVLTQTLT